MPAPAMLFSVSRQLELLEDQLHEGYGFLLSILPRGLFETRNGNVILSQRYYHPDDNEEPLVYGVLTGEGHILQLCAGTTFEGNELGKYAPNPSHKGIILSTLDDRLAAFNRVPPLSWIEPSPDWYGSLAWGKHTSALIRYYMLIWAFEEKHPGHVPAPHPDHLREALDLLKQTRYYERATVRREDDKFLDIHISQRESQNIRALQRLLQAGQVHSAPPESPDGQLGGFEPGGSRTSPSKTLDMESQDDHDVPFSEHASRRRSDEGPVQTLVERLQIRSDRDTVFSDFADASFSGERDETASGSATEESLQDMNNLNLDVEGGVSKAALSAELVLSRAMPTTEVARKRREDLQYTTLADSPTPTDILVDATLAVSPLAVECEEQYRRPVPVSNIANLAEHVDTVPDARPPLTIRYEGQLQGLTSTSVSPCTATQPNTTAGAISLRFPHVAEGDQRNLWLVPSHDESRSIEHTDDLLVKRIIEASPAVASHPQNQQRKPDLEATVDPHLAHLQKMVGRDLLSLLPHLYTTTFKKLHPQQERRGYLSIRMLFGTINQFAPPHLRGHKVWIVYKIHEKDARTAPRMLLYALSSNDDDFVERMTFKSTLPVLDLEPPFDVVTEVGVRREHQLKAVVKYYYILAANAGQYGFKQHLMPANDSFIEQMRTVCRRIQNHDATPQPRKRRRLAAEYDPAMPSVSDVDEGTAMNLAHLSRRSGRHRKRPLSLVIDSGTSDHESPTPPRHTPKMALGPLIETDTPSHIRNHFLDPDAEPCDSDGNSGDEIPSGIPGHIHDLLLKRSEAKNMMHVHNLWIKEHREMKGEHTKEVWRLEGLVKRGRETLETTQHSIKMEKRLASNYQNRIEVRQEAISRFREKEKSYNDQVKLIDTRYVRLWDEVKKQKEGHEVQKQQERDNK